MITRDQLMKDVKQQFQALTSFQSSFVRDGVVIETLVQTAEAEATAFTFLHRRWSLARRGEYAFAKLDGVWVIQRVRVLSEKLSPAGWRIGARQAG